jgi:hypothetical protein
MRHYVWVAVLALIASGCGMTANTPAQDLAYQRVQKCQGVSNNVILQRIESDGRVWVELRNGTAGLADWQQCMAKAAQDQPPAGTKP